MEKSFVKNGVKVWAKKDIYGRYYVTSAYSNKRPPEDNKKRIEFYKKGKLGNRIDKIQRNSKKYNTLASLKKSI
jgi:hypothetical protein